MALRRNIHIMETTTEYEKNIVLKILDGTCKVLLTHPEEKFNEVLPTVVQFLERTDHFPSEDRIKYMVLIEDEFKKVCTQSWHGWNNRLALERVYKTISNIRSGV